MEFQKESKRLKMLDAQTVSPAKATSADESRRQKLMKCCQEPVETLTRQGSMGV